MSNDEENVHQRPQMSKVVIHYFRFRFSLQFSISDIEFMYIRERSFCYTTKKRDETTTLAKIKIAFTVNP